MDDSSWVARDPQGGADAAPLFRARHLLLIFRGDGDDARRWPRRNVLLVDLPSGRWAAELAFVPSRSLDELVPHARVSNGSGTVETWAAGRPPGEEFDHERRPDPNDPCSGERVTMKGAAGALRFHLADAATRTVKRAVAELRDATFSSAEVVQLDALRRLRIPQAQEEERLVQARIAWALLLVDRTGSVEGADVALAPDPDPPGDLEAWRALAWLPEKTEPMGLPDGL